MEDKEKIYPKGMPRQSKEFSENQKFKLDIFQALKEIAHQATKKTFEDKGYKIKKGFAGVYANEEEYGHGTKLKEFNTKFSSRPNTNTYFEKIIYFGGKKTISEVNIGYDADAKFIEMSYISYI